MTTLESPPTDDSFSRIEKLSDANTDATTYETSLPRGMSRLESQIAGHLSDEKKRTIGMLRGPTGCVFKPVVKPVLGEREIAFYEYLESSKDPIAIELKKYVPEYCGTAELQIGDKLVKFLKLKDITEGMAEPCVMDIKIGRRTWDPLATPEKKAAEESKYAATKRTWGFCIPGFQVYTIPSGELKKFGKEYCKKLNEESVKEALATFFNVTPEKPACRQLLVKLLSFLWKIMLFFRMQKKLRFYSSSLLIAYDARRLRRCLRDELEQSIQQSSNIAFRARSYSSSNAHSPAKNAHHAKLKRHLGLERVFALKRSVSLNSTVVDKSEPVSIPRNVNRSDSHGSSTSFGKLCRTHSYENNFDNDMERMKEDYDTILNELNGTPLDKQNWVRVNMIDFTHVFPAEDETKLDVNYLDGIEKLIKLLETFLDRKPPYHL